METMSEVIPVTVTGTEPHENALPFRTA